MKIKGNSRKGEVVREEHRVQAIQVENKATPGSQRPAHIGDFMQTIYKNMAHKSAPDITLHEPSVEPSTWKNPKTPGPVIMYVLSLLLDYHFELR